MRPVSWCTSAPDSRGGSGRSARSPCRWRTSVRVPGGGQLEALFQRASTIV
ncbi:MAG: hypothetical protein M5U28_04595 [Sandaracinaceae bacterium]|nr:hypothetical protein [Sandaracinaceae bacterium]